MTVTVHAAADGRPRVRRKPQAADVLAIGGSLVAPLNLLIVRSLTAYDVLVFLALVLLVRDRRLCWPERRYLAMAYLFVLAALLSAFRATYVSEALTQVLQYVFVFFIQVPVVLSVVRTRRRAVLCLVLLCVGTLGATLHAYLFTSTQGAGRALVFYSDNPNRLGYPTVYVLVFLAVFVRLARGLHGAARWAAWTACAGAAYLSLWAVFASGSRSSLLGTAAALIVFVVLRPGLRLVPRVGRGLALTAVVVLMVAGLVGAGQLPHTLEDRVHRSMDSDIQDQAGLVGDREHLAAAGVRAFVASPYLGTGLDNFRYVTTNYDAEATPQLPHNLWLQLLVQVGFFGTLAFGLMLLFWVRDLSAAARLLPAPDRDLVWGVAAAMAGILTIFMFAPEMLDRHYWLVFALGLAAAAGAGRENHLGGTP